MSNFEKLVYKMRKAQEQYNKNPTGENLEKVEDLEFEVDEKLDFLKNCKGSSYKDVKNYLRNL